MAGTTEKPAAGAAPTPATLGGVSLFVSAPPEVLLLSLFSLLLPRSFQGFCFSAAVWYTLLQPASLESLEYGFKLRLFFWWARNHRHQSRLLLVNLCWPASAGWIPVSSSNPGFRHSIRRSVCQRWPLDDPAAEVGQWPRGQPISCLCATLISRRRSRDERSGFCAALQLRSLNLSTRFFFFSS